MQVLAAADLHGRSRVYAWLVDAVRQYGVEALVLAGDLLGCPDGFDTPEDAQRHEAKALTDLLETAAVPVLYIMGNDDLVDLACHGARVQSIHGRRVTLGGFNFVGYQYSLPFMGGVFEKDESGIESDLAELTSLVDSQTVFVSHSPALGILDPGLGEMSIGSGALGHFLERRPFLVHVHGHSHGGFGRLGKHFNVASAGRLRAMIINLETLQHQVLGLEPHGLNGREDR
jgi:Icc-related predicted phosphoesterase